MTAPLCLLASGTPGGTISRMHYRGISCNHIVPANKPDELVKILLTLAGDKSAVAQTWRATLLGRSSELFCTISAEWRILMNNAG